MPSRATAPRASAARRPARSTAPSAAPLTAAQRAELITVLEDELAMVRRSATGSEDSFREQLESVGRIGGDVTDASIDMSAIEIAHVGMSRSQQQARLLVQALHRIKNTPAQFGLCVTCQEPIAFERLMTLPTATTCMRHSGR